MKAVRKSVLLALAVFGLLATLPSAGLAEETAKEPAEIAFFSESETIDLLVKALVVASSVTLIIALVLFLKTQIDRRRASEREPILFPSYDREPRLGGKYSGGTFVSISFDLGRDD